MTEANPDRKPRSAFLRVLVIVGLVVVGLVICLALWLAWHGRTTYFKVVSARVDSVSAPHVTISVDVDLDLQGPKWTKHTMRLDYIILDDERLDQIRTVNPSLPADVEKAGPILIREWREHYYASAWWDSPDVGKRLMQEGEGGFDPATSVSEGIWRHLIYVPFKNNLSDTQRSQLGGDAARPYSYSLEPGREYWLWGRVLGVMYLFEPQCESAPFALRFQVPKN